MTEADLSYAAGFIDADGSILIERSRDKRVVHRIRHVPRVCAVGIDRDPLEFLKLLFGGSICAQRHTNQGFIASKKVVFQWSVSSYAAVLTARALMPFLRIKSLPAYLLSCFDYEAQWSKGGKPEDARMPLSEFQRRERLVAEMRQANDRGLRIECKS